MNMDLTDEDKQLINIHKGKVGKVSDKWESYPIYYQELFEKIRDKPLRILEIGVQNGGSLETWERFFYNSQIIVGLDIDPRCASLIFDSVKIKVVVGDVNSEQAFQNIVSISETFDLIIDDGSHTSNDVIASFLKFFPLLAPAGTFVVEDTHCVLQKTNPGGSDLPNARGLYDFFYKVSGMLNYEFWADIIPLDTYWRTFFKNNDIPACISDGSIDSIYFRNSIITIFKAFSPGHFKRGQRLVSGRDMPVQDWGLSAR